MGQHPANLPNCSWARWSNDVVASGQGNNQTGSWPSRNLFTGGLCVFCIRIFSKTNASNDTTRILAPQRGKCRRSSCHPLDVTSGIRNRNQAPYGLSVGCSGQLAPVCRIACSLTRQFGKTMKHTHLRTLRSPIVENYLGWSRQTNKRPRNQRLPAEQRQGERA